MIYASSVMNDGICRAWEKAWYATISNKTG